MGLLNTASGIHIGSTPAKAVYAGDQKVWPSTPPPPENPVLVQTNTYAANSKTNWTDRITLPNPTTAGSALIWVDAIGIHNSKAPVHIESMSDSAGSNSWKKLYTWAWAPSTLWMCIEYWAAFDTKPVSWVESVRPQQDWGTLVEPYRQGRLFEIAGPSRLANYTTTVGSSSSSKVFKCADPSPPFAGGVTIHAAFQGGGLSPASVVPQSPYTAYPSLTGNNSPTSGGQLLVAIAIPPQPLSTSASWTIGSNRSYISRALWFGAT